MEFTLGRPDWHNTWLSWFEYIYIYIYIYMNLEHACMQLYRCDDKFLSGKVEVHVKREPNKWITSKKWITTKKWENLGFFFLKFHWWFDYEVAYLYMNFCFGFLRMIWWDHKLYIIGSLDSFLFGKKASWWVRGFLSSVSFGSKVSF